MRSARALPATPRQEPDDDALILSVALVSGHFESSIHIPLDATDSERQGFVEAWLNLMDAGIKVGKSKREEERRLKASERPVP